MRTKYLIKNIWFCLGFIFFVALVLRLFLYHTVYWRTNDAVEYINLARNIASGHGFVQSIKFRYFDNLPVVTSAFHGRMSLFSLFLAGIILLHGNEYTMQLFIFFIGALDAVLVYLLCRRFVSPTWSLLAGLMAASNPNLLISSRLILKEPLFAFFILLTLVALLYIKKQFLGIATAGVATACAYLTRTEGIFLLPLLAFFSLKSPSRILKLSLLVGSFALVCLSFWYGNFLVNGDPVYTHHSHFFQMRNYSEVSDGNGYGKVFPSAFTFLRNNISFVAQKLLYDFLYNMGCLIQFDFFNPLLFSLLLIFLISTWKKFGIYYAYSFLILLIYTVAWSINYENSRSFTIIYLLLLVPISYMLQQLSKTSRIVTVLLLLSIFIPYGAYDVHRIIWARTTDMQADAWSVPARKPVYAWILKHTSLQDIISSTSPEMVYLFTNRPGIRTPVVLSEKNYTQYVGYYHVAYFLVEDKKQFAFFAQKAHLQASFPADNIYAVK